MLTKLGSVINHTLPAHYMIFHKSREKANDCGVILNDVIVKCMTPTKYLGIISDEKTGLEGAYYVNNKITKSIKIQLQLQG